MSSFIGTVVVVVVVDCVNDIGFKHRVVDVDNVNNIVGVCTGVRNTPCIDKGSGVAPIFRVRVLPFEKCLFLVSRSMVHIQIGEGLSQFHEEVAGIGVMVGLSACSALPLET